MMARINLQLFAGEKTEPATPRRREEARKKGQVAKSGELGVAVMVLVGFLTISALRPFWMDRIQSLVRHFLSTAHEWDGSISALQGIFLTALYQAGLVLVPVLAALFVFAFASQALQVGFMFTGESIMPKFSRINPVEGFRRIFSKRALVEFLKSVIKIIIVAYLVYRQLRGAVGWVVGLGLTDLLQSFQLMGDTIVRMASWVGVVLLIFAAADYLYQRWEFEQSIMMSKEEIKEELRQTEGDPLVRSKIRQKQRQLAASRMMAAIPTADVVVTNPTHYAVALRYKADDMEAPQVVAKGMGHVAAKIKEIAAEHGVTIVSKPELARALYKTTEVGQQIPPDLYPAVAELLAFVYRLRNKAAQA
ncbi:MAG: flagellar biosynthesis protein FlhB [Firmicutes bacterium]|nr:flagellar biosynthesis protein FlhB [Bacillota bacterium]